jgi:cytochrome c5
VRALSFLLVAVLFGCGGGPSADGDVAACTRADPSCPEVVPSYASEIAPIFKNSCVGCHHPGSPYSPTSLVDYEAVHEAYGSSLGQVEACLMPPSGTEAPLSDAERAAVLAWLACGAPDN